MSTGPELRIGDAERDAAVTALGEHYAAGRLTKDELDERCDRAWAARTASSLWPLFEDLPRPSRPAAPPASGGTATPGRARGGRAGRWPVPSGPWSLALAVVLALVLVAHLPVVLFVAVAWLLLTRSRATAGPGGRGGWCRPDR